jgi:hypothetical protein
VGSRQVVLLALLAACGRLDFGDVPVDVPDGGTNDRVAPEVCWVTGWSTVTFSDLAVDLSVATTPNGVSVVWVPTAGGDLSGINLDRNWRLSANPGVVQSGTWLRSSVTWFDGTLVTAELESGAVKIFSSQPDLGGSSEIGCPIATAVSKQPLLHASSDTVLLTGWDLGLVVTPYDAALSSQPSMMSVASDPVTALTATELGSKALAVWSTASTCFVEQVMDMATGIGSSNAVPCSSPRVAASSDMVALTFEGPSGIYLSTGAPDTIGSATARLLAPGGTSPRVTFDGTRFWISYLDGNGHVVAGYLSSTGELLTTSITTSPTHDAYEMLIVNGSPWVFAVDAGGLAATMLCLAP